MAIERMPITPAVLTWARERAGYKLEALATKRRDFKKIAEWESGSARPTYRQLELLAKDLWLPLAVFFFPEPPQLPDIEKSFRTMGTQQFSEVPPRVRLLLHKARAFQVGLAELNDGRNPARRLLSRELHFTAADPVSFMAAQIRDFLGITLDEQFAWRKDDTALKAWRAAFFKVGVTVFKDAFGEETYCGFSLYDEEFPIIYVNNSNAKTRQIFTLCHELAHLVFRTSGIDKDGGFRSAPSIDKQQLERKCNRLAAAILLPEEAFKRELRDWRAPKAMAEDLAKKFSVSREVIYRKFLELELVTETDYQAAQKLWAAQWRDRKGSGGNFYRTKIAYLGDGYIELAFRRFYQNRIDEEALADYLDILPRNLERFEDTFFEARS